MSMRLPHSIPVGATLAALALVLGCDGPAPTSPHPHLLADRGQPSGCTNISGTIVASFLPGWMPGPGPVADPTPPGPTDPNTDIVGHVFGSVNGDAFAKIDAIRPSDDGTLHVALRHTYVARDAAGAELGRVYTSDEGVLDPFAPPAYRFNNRLAVIGGAGAFAGATGMIQGHGSVNLGTGAIALDYTGRVCS
jgi:hypothetical protein